MYNLEQANEKKSKQIIILVNLHKECSICDKNQCKSTYKRLLYKRYYDFLFKNQKKLNISYI